MRNSSIIMYTTKDGLTKIETTFDEDTVWLSLDQMAELFQRDKSTISRHIKNIFEESELQRNSVVAKFATTASDGKTYQVDHYNLDVIISVGYRVKSHRGTQFRIWAMGILKEYMKKDMFGGIIHCFSYSKEIAAEYLKMGLYLGIGGVLTFKNAKKLKEVAAIAPLSQIVLETDCPYMAPEPNRGRRNSSLNLPYVAEALAQIKGITAEEVIAVTEENAKRLLFRA